MKRFRFAGQIYCESFGDEALLLAAESDKVFTVNAAAADLFATLNEAFRARSFTLQDGCRFLATRYQIPFEAALRQARDLLAFALKHGVVHQVVESSERKGSSR